MKLFYCEYISYTFSEAAVVAAKDEKEAEKLLSEIGWNNCKIKPIDKSYSHVIVHTRNGAII